MVASRLAAAFLSLAATAHAQSATPRSDTMVMSLPALVANALRNNTDLRAASFAPSLAESDMLSARALLDPAFSVGSDVGNSANDVFGVSSRSTQSSLVNTASVS